MRQADLSELEKVVGDVFGKSAFANDFVGAVIATDEFDDESSFIRILIRLNNIDKLSEIDADVITSSIEEAISERDDRFPSVRFSDP